MSDWTGYAIFLAGLFAAIAYLMHRPARPGELPDALKVATMIFFAVVSALIALRHP